MNFTPFLAFFTTLLEIGLPGLAGLNALSYRAMYRLPAQSFFVSAALHPTRKPKESSPARVKVVGERAPSFLGGAPLSGEAAFLSF